MSWYEANQAYLMRELDAVRRAVERCVGATSRPIEEAQKNGAIMSCNSPPLPPACNRASKWAR